MDVSELGEFGLIDLIEKTISSSVNKQFTSWQKLIIGIGDDAAAWHGDTSVQLATVDCLNQDVHFSLDTTTWKELGWKSLAINLSDIAAMGGEPRYALVSLALSEKTRVEDVISLYHGMIEASEQFEVAIIGGNISRAPLVSITITVLGISGKGLLTRSGARKGDKIAVTGYLGGAAGGLQTLQNGLKFDTEATEHLRKAFLHPVPRVAEGKLLVENGVNTAIDISDGLVSDLRHICEASHVGANVEVERLPIHPIVRRNFGDKAIEMALSGGEDYELLFTCISRIMDKVQSTLPCPVTVIGEITGGNKVDLFDKHGNIFQLPRAGWEHFKS